MPRKRAHGEGTISRRRDGTWEGKLSLGYGPDGKRVRKTVYGRTQAQVRAKLERLKHDLADGVYSDTTLTVAQYLERWLDAKANVRPATLRSYRDTIRLHIAPHLGRKQLAKLTPLDVQRLVAHLAEAVSPHTANYARQVLSMALRQAVRWQLIVRNVAEATEPVKHQPRRQVIWTPEEAARFLDTARSHRLYALFHLIMATGLRHGEALGLHWSDIQGGTLHVREAKTAKGVRRVSIGADVVAVLEHHRRQQDAERYAAAQSGAPWPDSDLVFTSEAGTPLDKANVHRVRRKLERDAGVRPATVHDLRHLNVSIRRRLGQDAKVIADQIGHTDPSFTTRLYTHLFEDDREAAAVNLAEALKT
jgi:integrase